MSRLAWLRVVRWLALAIPPALGASSALADARGDCFAKSGEAAIRACSEAIALNPRDAVSYINRAFEYVQNGDYARGIADYSRAIEIDPRRWDARQGRAWTSFKAGRPAEGLDDADAALKLKPDWAQGLDTRAHILEALGRREEAIADFRRALAIEPRLQGSRDGLKRLDAAP
jgi:tetratricopeptide (TPR) repeat protein